MNHLFSINAEGGPLLCLDANGALAWRGAEGDGGDYNNLCLSIDAEPNFSAKLIAMGGVPCVVWEMQGAGTADVFVDSSGMIRILRAWLAEDTADELQNLADGEAHSRGEIGEIDVRSGVLAVFWAAESGEQMPQDIDVLFKEAGGSAIDESTFAIKVASGRYKCFDEFIEAGQSQARRLTLIPK